MFRHLFSLDQILFRKTVRHDIENKISVEVIHVECWQESINPQCPAMVFIKQPRAIHTTLNKFMTLEFLPSVDINSSKA